MGREGGVGSGFYRPGGARNKEGKQGIRSPAMRGRRRWLSLHGRAIGGRRKENAGGGKGSSGKKKGKKERALTGGAGAQRERKREGERRSGFG